ncbi:MAG: nucleotide sugar dehydrogenase [Desulfonauticus sp.]|nr:nucleotide sugar dehydrogenase [Desulfonauticus sp.]
MLDFQSLKQKKEKIAVIGLGYVGLPLAVALSRHFEVIGFDISARRVEELSRGIDVTKEVEDKDLQQTKIYYTCEAKDIQKAKFIIVAVPTPIDKYRTPDLKPILGASKTVGENLTKDSVVVYESTVYPGLTEEKCVPVLEQYSGLTCGQDFWVGYSPERINPGDKKHTLENIVKVVAGQTKEVTDLLAQVYGAIIKAGIHKASSIKVAEAAKVIENTQRDLNIALMNELALIFDRMGIDTLEVLEAAKTKWNFLPFYPGLVGGHCIGVDPYYLTFKAEALGYHPEVILAGRRINDYMGKFIAEKTVKLLVQKKCELKQAKIGVLGLTFKENVPDLRNTKVVDVVRELEDFGLQVLVHDPLASAEEARQIYNITLWPFEKLTDLDVLILAVAHNIYKELPFSRFLTCFKEPKEGLIIDIKGMLNREEVLNLGLTYWRL